MTGTDLRLEALEAIVAEIKTLKSEMALMNETLITIKNNQKL